VGIHLSAVCDIITTTLTS